MLFRNGDGHRLLEIEPEQGLGSSNPINAFLIGNLTILPIGVMYHGPWFPMKILERVNNIKVQKRFRHKCFPSLFDYWCREQKQCWDILIHTNLELEKVH